MAPKRKKFFASYSRHDRPIVEPVIRFLRTSAAPVFFDIDSISPGDQWRERLDNSLADATTLVLFWSKASSESEWVAKEWAQAVSQQKEVIPVILDSTPLPDEIAEFQWIAWRPMLAHIATRPTEPTFAPRRFSIVKFIFDAIIEFITSLLSGFADHRHMDRSEYDGGLPTPIILSKDQIETLAESLMPRFAG